MVGRRRLNGFHPQGRVHRLIITVCAQPLYFRLNKLGATILHSMVTGDNYFDTSDVARVCVLLGWRHSKRRPVCTRLEKFLQLDRLGRPALIQKNQSVLFVLKPPQVRSLVVAAVAKIHSSLRHKRLCESGFSNTRRTVKNQKRISVFEGFKMHQPPSDFIWHTESKLSVTQSSIVKVMNLLDL